ncbi:hypothetical protein M0Q97_08175 [Candidatus Dojkabacteria bacterium]|jgi:hypothetical protein|nr:hypothetical protein [Candidatus Dojkabacteria bacterium]
MNNTIEKIHSSVDSAVDRLKEISTIYLKQSEEPTEEVYSDKIDKLKDLGFNNVREVREYDSKKSIYSKEIHKKSFLKNKANAINEDVSYYSKIYPFHKFIYYSQLIPICEKYGLVLGSVEFYNADIPKKNSEEIINFEYDKCNKKLSLNNIAPLFNQSNNYADDRIKKLYICAPKQDFVKDLTQIGIEVYKGSYTKISLKSYLEPKPKDPIVLLPVKSSLVNQIGFIVISKWGLEADDIDLMVGNNN